MKNIQPTKTQHYHSTTTWKPITVNLHWRSSCNVYLTLYLSICTLLSIMQIYFASHLVNLHWNSSCKFTRQNTHLQTEITVNPNAEETKLLTDSRIPWSVSQTSLTQREDWETYSFRGSKPKELYKKRNCEYSKHMQARKMQQNLHLQTTQSIRSEAPPTPEQGTTLLQLHTRQIMEWKHCLCPHIHTYTYNYINNQRSATQIYFSTYQRITLTNSWVDLFCLFTKSLESQWSSIQKVAVLEISKKFKGSVSETKLGLNFFFSSFDKSS